MSGSVITLSDKLSNYDEALIEVSINQAARLTMLVNLKNIVLSASSWYELKRLDNQYFQFAFTSDNEFKVVATSGYTHMAVWAK